MIRMPVNSIIPQIYKDCVMIYIYIHTYAWSCVINVSSVLFVVCLLSLNAALRLTPWSSVDAVINADPLGLNVSTYCKHVLLLNENVIPLAVAVSIYNVTVPFLNLSLISCSDLFDNRLLNYQQSLIYQMTMRVLWMHY